MGTLQFFNKRTLKLTNVLMYKLLLNEIEVYNDLDSVVEKMQNYINIKGSVQVGPLIQNMSFVSDENGNVSNVLTIMLQSSNYINNVEFPYSMESIIRIKDAMYCRFHGPENMIGLAYSKIKVEAFEGDIPLKGDSYTIFVDRDEENETIIADVFMERAD